MDILLFQHRFEHSGKNTKILLKGNEELTAKRTGKIAISVPLDYSFYTLKKKDIVWKRTAKKLFELKYSCTAHAMC